MKRHRICLILVTPTSFFVTHPTEGIPALARPDLLGAAKKRLSFIERVNLRLVRRSFRPGLFSNLLRLLQRTVGQAWIHHSTKRLRRVYGLERLPDLDSSGSVIIVANHRSFFDLYVVTAELVRRKMKKRIIFMVRSNFFYDSPIGIFVNFCMSFLAMYPPVFRDRRKLLMNTLALEELSWLLRQGGMFAGLHPEGTRNRDADPYTFLPAKPGVGRVIQMARVPVVPVFVNGLGNDLVKQVRGNFDGSGEKVAIIFGKPIDFGHLLDEPPSAHLHRQIAEHCMEAISHLAEEERSLRSCGALGS
jgi:1-acyl-sn-glycerol-3-phosphate acyltransferase